MLCNIAKEMQASKSKMNKNSVSKSKICLIMILSKFRRI